MVDNHEAVDHDEACAQEVRKRWELGCFEEQIIVYATCYTMDEKMYYFMSDNGENAYKFAEQKLKEGIYCLPIVRSAVSQLIPSGKKEELFREMKINTAIQIKQSHGPEIMGIVSKLSPRNNSVGIELLDHLKETISGCFNDEVLQIFSGLVHLTYYAGKITHFDFLKYQNLLIAAYTPGEAEEIVHNVHERLYSGFAYIDEYGKVKYYYNALRVSTLQRQSELRQQKILVTPIYEKRYCFNNVDEFPKVIEHFKQQLRSVFDESYFRVLRYIYNLPSLAVKNDFDLSYQQAIKEKNLLLQRTLNYYGTLWHVW